MKFLLILLFSFLVFFQVSAQHINGATTAQVGQCTSYSLGSWGNACVTAMWSASGGTVSTGGYTSSTEVCWTTPGTHTVSASDNCGKSAFIQVYVSCAPVFISPSTTVACIGQPVTLSASGYDSYSWTGANGSGSTASFTPTSAGSHTVSVTGTTGNCSSTRSVTIQVNPTASVSSPVTIQAGQSITLCASGGTSYSWSNGSTSSCITVSPTTTTSYSVTINSPCGSKTLQTSVNVAGGGPLSINANSACTGQSIQASASGGTPPYSFSASAPIISQNGQFGVATISATSVGSVTITVSDSNGQSASTTVSVSQTPSFSISGGGTVCAGQSATLSIIGGNANSYSWSIVSGSGSLSNSSGTSTSVTPTSGYVSVMATGTNGSCSSSASRAVYGAGGQVAISTASTTLCGTSQVVIYGSGASSYSWSVNGSPYGGSGSSIQLSISQPTTVTVSGVDNCGGTSSASLSFSVAPAIDLEVTPQTDRFILGESVNYVASSTEPLTYVWYDETGTTQLGTGQTFTQTPTENTTYTLVASNGVCELVKQVEAVLVVERDLVFCSPFKDQTFESIPAESYSIQNPDYDKNYVRSETMLTPVRTQTEVDALQINNDGKAVAFGFFDGLGRDEQTVQIETSPNGNNIIQHIEYDEFGRMPKGFLPHTARNTTNPFQQNAATEQAAFYADPMADYATTTIPYSEKIFENSPYSRVLEQAAQGEAYSLQSGHTIQAKERPNTLDDQVHQWYYEVASGRLVSDNFYATGELWVNETQDEHGTKTWQFTDKLGRLVLQRSEIEATQYNEGAPVETYYVYHNRFLKKPQFIIQPEGVYNRYGLETAYLIPQEVTNWAFRYEYDGRGRVHRKWIPGQEGASTFIYDERDRMILAQTPNQVADREWTFTKYDVLNRPVMSGLYRSTQTVSALQSTLESQQVQNMYEHREVDVPFGYSNISFPILEDAESVLSVIYYDGYCDIFDEEANAESFLFAANPLVDEEEQAATVRGLTTVSKTRVLDDNGEWLASVIYYDDYARSIQIQTQQMGGEWDMMTNLYDFSGKVLTTYQEHQSQIEPVVVQQNFEYDHAGRLLKTYHKINQQEMILLSNVRYNEVGQVKGKGLHKAVPLQDITFQYNIRGWLTHINDLSTIRQSQDSKLFAFQIHYEEADQYNGNIGKVEWKTVTDAVQRGYEFGYDKLNRLKYAKYLTADRRYNEEYSVFGITYDQNGNILTLNRNGLLKMDALEDPTQLNKQYGQIDNLDYSYTEPTRLRSNRLLNVTDQVGQTSGIAGDFQDGNNSSAPDYEYDKNGNLLTDTNKGIAEIKYNHLNLPEIIYFENENQILNTYDAAGIKLKSEIVENGVPLRTTYYKNGFIYEQKSTDPELQLSFFGTAEGRIVKKEERFVYEYHYKDHLGNLRVAFQAKEDGERERFSLTMEADSAKKEEAEFENVAAARSDLKDKEGHYSAELENSKQPISKTLQVKKGDRIKASVFATHDPIIAETDPTKAIEEAKKDVLLSLGAAAAGVVNINPTQQKIEIPVNPEISPATTQTIESPKVQLNLLDFIPVIRNLRALKRAKKAKGLEPDMYFVPKGELVLELRDSTDSLIFEKREKLTISSAIAWEKLISEYEVSEDGNLNIYIDNSSSDKVYFDEFIIERTEATVAVVVQENHYYPFGMNMKGIEELDIQSLDGTDEHRFQYNGKEKEESFGLNWTDYGWRNMDTQLGRFTKIDRFSEKYYSLSSYNYVGNNPISRIDINGDSILVLEKYQGMYLEDLAAVFGDKVADFGFGDNAKLSFTGNKDNYTGDELEILNGMLHMIEESVVTVVFYEDKLRITDEIVVESAGESGGLSILASENTGLLNINIILISPNKTPTELTYNESSQGFPLKTVNNSRAATLFHEKGHIIHDGEDQTKVINFDNRARAAHKTQSPEGNYESNPLDERTTDMTHASYSGGTVVGGK